MRHRYALAIPLAFGVLLSACSSDGDQDQPEAATDARSGTTTSPQKKPQSLTEGGSFEVPCGPIDPAACMTVKINHVYPTAECLRPGEHPGERFVRLDLEASMPEGASPEFQSPFRMQPWRASTADKKISRVDESQLCAGDTKLNLMDEFPGYSADGVVFLPVPEDAELLHFEASGKKIAAIDIKATPGADQLEQDQSPGPANGQQQPENHPADVPATPAEVATPIADAAQPSA